MACDTIKIETLDADEVVSIVTQGPQGPSGAEAATLTTQGDTLYRGLTTNQRLPIGAPGQVLKVNSGATAPEWANESGAVTEVNGQTGAVTLTASDVGAAPATSISPSAISGTAVVDSDARLTDSRTPTTHAASHAAGQADQILPSDIGAQSIFVTEDLGTITANVTLTAARAKIYTLNTATSGLRILLPASDVLAGDIVQIIFVSPTGQSITPVRGTMSGFFAPDIGPAGGPVTFIAASASGTSWDVALVDRHTHGNITNLGAIGTTSGLPIKTWTSGVLIAGAFGGGAGEFAEGNHTHADLHTRSHAITSTSDHTAGNHKVFYSDGTGSVVELALGNSGEVLTSNGATSAPSFAAASGGVSAVGASAADILSVSGSDLVADDPNADRLVFWDDSASKLTHLATVGPTFDGTNLRWPVELVVACSDESTDLTTGTAKVTFRAPYAFLLTGVRASVNTAPTGSTLIVDINNGANSALSTKLSIDASEKTSTTAATAAVIDTSYDDFSDDAEITIDIDQIGSTVAGKGLKVTLIGTRA